MGDRISDENISDGEENPPVKNEAAVVPVPPEISSPKKQQILNLKLKSPVVYNQWRKYFVETVRSIHNWQFGRYKSQTLSEGVDDFYEHQHQHDNTTCIYEDCPYLAMNIHQPIIAGCSVVNLVNGVQDCITNVPNVNRIVAGTNVGRIYVWNKLTLTDSWQLDSTLTEQPLYSANQEKVLCVYQDDTILASAHRNGTLIKRSAITGQVIGTLSKSTHNTLWSQCVQFNRKIIVSDGKVSTIKIWDFETGNQLNILDGHSYQVSCLKFDINTNRIVSGYADGMIKVFDLQTGRCVQNIRADEPVEARVNCVDFDEYKIISGATDKTISVWDIRCEGMSIKQRTHSFFGHNGAVLCLKFDDLKLVSGSEDKSIKVWDFRHALHDIYSLRSNTRAVVCLDFNHNSMVSGSRDGKIFLWNFR